MNTIGNRIRSRRLELSMSQDELAQKLCYTNKSSISRIESGKYDIPQSKVVEFANALNTTVSYLMGWEDNPRLVELSKETAYKAQLDRIIDKLSNDAKQKLISYAEFLLNSES